MEPWEKNALNPRLFPPGMQPAPPPGYPSQRELPSVPDKSWKNGAWTTGTIPLNFSAPANGNRFGDITGVVAQALWQSPLFDLKGYLNASAGIANDLAIMLGDGNGGGASLDVMLQGVNALIASGLECQFYALEYGHPWQPQLINKIGMREDITTEVLDAAATVTGEDGDGPVLHFDPPGMRYWRVVLVVNITSGGMEPVPQLTLNAAAE